jgi:tRNA pseudouridine55 synthase
VTRGTAPARATTPAGVVVVDKPSGWTSHDVVARVRRLAGTRKVGHAGTLDPMATGVLVVGLHRATRLLGHLTATEKSYEATVRLGESTLTDDAEGELTGRRDASVLDEAQIRQAVADLTGDLLQVPSSVSAVKVGGRRSYARVRQGERVDLPARPVHVGAFEVRAVRPREQVVDLDVTVVCSSGTYVRALARDLGVALGVGGHLTRLRRTRVGTFGEDQARSLGELEQHLQVVPLDEVARRSFPCHEASAEEAEHVRHGRPLRGTRLATVGAAEGRATGPVAVVAPDGAFLALYEQHGDDARPVAVFT